ncbi:MAG: 50S ribosomal protein L22 [Candidatus Saccharibacteria bacterium]
MSKSVVVRSYIEGVDQSNRKVALVASLVRRRTVADALVILSHVPKRAALPVIKAINSAKANAINNHELDGKTLIISTISVTSGTRLKRFVPASKGRALPFEKKTSNILVEVTGDLKAKKVASADKTTKTTVKTAGKKEVK